MTDMRMIPGQATHDEIDLGGLLSVVWRGKVLVLLCALLATIGGGYYAFLGAVPLYPAQVTLALDTQQQQVISDIESIFAGGGTDTAAINTEIEVFRSRALIGRLVDDLDLVSDPEFNARLRDPGLISQLMRAVSGAADTPPDAAVTRNRVIDTLIGRMSITNVRQSFVFVLRIETTDPLKSARIVNRLAELYIEAQILRKLDDVTRAIEFLSQRTAELELNVEEREQALATRMESSNVTTAEVLQAQNLQLRDLRERIDEAERRGAETRALADLLGAASDPEAAFAALDATGDGRYIGLVQRYRTGRIEAEEAAAGIVGILDDLDDETRRTEAQLSSLRASAESLGAAIAARSTELIDLQQLEREVEAARLLYGTFLARLQEASVQRGLETADSRILSEAVPRPASSPQQSRILMLSALVGAVAGVMIVAIREWRFAGFRTPDAIRQHTGLSVLGSIPAMPSTDRRQALVYIKGNPKSVFAEAMRNLRTSILMANLDREPKVILVTSSIPGEGKTTVSIALSRLMGALDGKTCLLVEADIRRQTLRAYAEIGGLGVSLVDVVLGRADLAQVDLFSPDLGVDVLSGSDAEFNAADLFASRRFGDLMQVLRARYDYIVIDSPPVLAVPDARVLSAQADATIFAVRWSATTRLQVRQGLDMLDSVGRGVSGIVLTQVDHRKMKRYGYGGQYGYDGYASGYYGKGS